jgi:hypothetical protein
MKSSRILVSIEVKLSCEALVDQCARPDGSSKQNQVKRAQGLCNRPCPGIGGRVDHLDVRERWPKRTISAPLHPKSDVEALHAGSAASEMRELPLRAGFREKFLAPNGAIAT